MTEMTKHVGSCHCGKVRYEVNAAIDKVMACNCSMCGRVGSLLFFVPRSEFSLKSGEDNLTNYQFNKHVIHHVFCKTCGIKSFAYGKRPDGSDMVAINARCLEGFDPEKAQIQHYDGRSH
jgi:hypothetical protein